VTLWPTGQSQPVVATLNSMDGRIKANGAIIAAGSGGAVSVFATNDTHVVLDINGYFVPVGAGGALAFYPLTPCRIADTRAAGGFSGAFGPPSLAASTTRTFPIPSSGCNVPSSAQAYSLNFAVIPPGPLGFLEAWPTGQSQPVVSTLNDPTGTIVANAAIVPAGTSGGINVIATNPADLIIDINGYFAPPGPGGLSLFTPAPCRVLDTRASPGAPFRGQMDVNGTASPCGIPNSAQAYVFNTTAIPQGALGYLTLWAKGSPRPAVSTLNAVDVAITNNMAMVPANNARSAPLRAIALT
jgi:hypothetical protein